ncbi:hypothetical protein SAMN06297164_3647 [Nitrosomonas ureae]|uniref:Uncharacterized protein n=1 Tax=Nitrosomonas ureae TaxID=44577 RepID=A0A286AM96_9PROT|nr:hypothetical protein SAMN06297164_3647 [Nitrosomonas ureae]
MDSAYSATASFTDLLTLDTQLKINCIAFIAEYEAIDNEVLYQSNLIKLIRGA